MEDGDDDDNDDDDETTLMVARRMGREASDFAAWQEGSRRQARRSQRCSAKVATALGCFEIILPVVMPLSGSARVQCRLV
jgi:hypothetical protein